MADLNTSCDIQKKGDLSLFWQEARLPLGNGTATELIMQTRWGKVCFLISTFPKNIYSCASNSRICHYPPPPRQGIQIGFLTSRCGLWISWNNNSSPDYTEPFTWKKWLLKRVVSIALYHAEFPSSPDHPQNLQKCPDSELATLDQI